MYDSFLSRAAEMIQNIDLGDIEGATDAEHSGDLSVSRQKGGKILLSPGSRAEKGKLIVHGKDSLVHVAAGARLSGTRIHIRGERSAVIIGPNVKLKGVILNVSSDGLIVIGADTSWESGAALCEDGRVVAIGNDCMFSNHVIMRTHDSHGIWDNETGQIINHSRDIKIGHHVWLGNSSRVNKGSVVGMGAVVGQCAVVSGNVEAESIYAGMPARKIKSNIHWTRSSTLDNIPEDYRADRSLKE